MSPDSVVLKNMETCGTLTLFHYISGLQTGGLNLFWEGHALLPEGLQIVRDHRLGCAFPAITVIPKVAMCATLPLQP